MDKLWVNSGDGHVFEPKDLWQQGMPARLAARAPHGVQDERYDTSYVDGEIIRRDRAQFRLPRPPGAVSLDLRLKDMDNEGVWAQLQFPSGALYCAFIRDYELWAACAHAYNDWLTSDMLPYSPRFVGVGIISAMDTDDAIKEAQRAVTLGCKGILLCDGPPEGREYNLEVWEPFWSAVEELNVPLCMHIGTGRTYKVGRGPGTALINYCESGYHCIRSVSHLVASGVLERHPRLRVTVAESGAVWVPYLGDRLDEAYRQHSAFAFPPLEVPPGETIRRQVYTSFQHDRTAVAAVSSLGYTNVMWGDDYPHFEGTFGHSQEVLRDLFTAASPEVIQRVTQGAFRELFDVPPIPHNENNLVGAGS
jgi:predicted TIM-barrel fold metal-dependent hydrolase